MMDDQTDAGDVAEGAVFEPEDLRVSIPTTRRYPAWGTAVFRTDVDNLTSKDTLPFTRLKMRLSTSWQGAMNAARAEGITDVEQIIEAAGMSDDQADLFVALDKALVLVFLVEWDHVLPRPKTIADMMALPYQIGDALVLAVADLGAELVQTMDGSGHGPSAAGDPDSPTGASGALSLRQGLTAQSESENLTPEPASI